MSSTCIYTVSSSVQNRYSTVDLNTQSNWLTVKKLETWLDTWNLKIVEAWKLLELELSIDNDSIMKDWFSTFYI